jgi:zinc protease
VSVSTRPGPGAARPYEFPAVHRAVLANGVRIMVAPMPRLPLVTVLALVDAGAAIETDGNEGTAGLTARTLTEGTGDLDGAALTDRLERLGTALDGYADWDSSVARFTVTRSRLDAAFALFADVLCAPSFPVPDIARRRDERLADLEQQLAEPRGLADVRFSGFLYDQRCRYARPASGTTRSVSRLDASVVRAFHARQYRPAATTLIFVGDITPEQAFALAMQRFGTWSGEGSVRRPTLALAASPRRRTILVGKPGAPQTELRVGHIGVPREHPDHLAIVMMNGLLGGFFSSRINLNLRERHAFTYGASSGFDWRRGAGPFVVSTAVKTEVTARAVEEILLEIDAMRALPPSAGEMALATEYLAGVFPIRYESTSSVAGALANATVFALPEDWFTRYRDRIRAITAGEVHAAARAHLDPGRIQILALGDPDTIADPLAKLGIGPMEQHPSDYDPAEAS